MMTNQVIKGTAKGDLMRFKSYLYDNTAIHGLGGPDIIQLNDVFGAKVYGGAGADILQSVFGFKNLLAGGAGQDIYYGNGDSALKIADTQGASGVHLNDVDGARVTLGNGDDVVKDKGGHGNVLNMGGGHDEFTETNSAGGNRVVFGNDGGMSDVATFDYRMVGGMSDGLTFIGSNKPDTVVAGDGALDINIKAPYAWDNVSGRAEINVVGFKSASDGIWFNQGETPDFVVVDGDEMMATFLGEDGISIFQVAVRGVGRSFPDQVTDGGNFYGGPVDSNGKYQEVFGNTGGSEANGANGFS